MFVVKNKVFGLVLIRFTGFCERSLIGATKNGFYPLK
jgi:hypothetical protein